MTPSCSIQLMAVFEAWCGHQRQVGRLRRGSSEAVYRAMWQALATWCDTQRPPLKLSTLDSGSLLRYLASRSGMAGPGESLTPRYQWRLLSLVRWVQAHSATQADAPRPARNDAAAQLIAAQPAVRRANAAHDDEVPACLSEADCAQLLAWLNGHLFGDDQGPAMARDASGIVPGAAPSPRWQSLRNRCAVALQLGAGLGPGEVRALRLDDVLGPGGPPHDKAQAWHLPAQLRVPASGSAPAHVAPIAPWAAQWLARWLQLRQQQALAGPWLFPSTRGGKPWGKVAQYGAAQQVLADAGLTPGAGGSFRLRHSFALRQLQAGLPAETVAAWLGVADPAVMARYQRLLDPAPRQAVRLDGAAMAKPSRPV